MGDFTAEWLALREPADHRSRSDALTRDLVASLAPGASILDLACGTGSNQRYLERYLQSPDWLLVDRDAALLSLIPPSPHIRVRTHDLRTVTMSLFEGRSLVTASALLDLVSESWICELAARCRRSHAAVLFALTYDGRIACEPSEREDTLVRELVNQHQRTDKGFGPALGPDAVPVATDAFRSVGYVVRTEPSDWVLSDTAATAALQRALVDGWASAAREMSPGDSATIEAWRTKRVAHVDAGRSVLTVGHHDLSAVLPTTR
jgi:hypothetical protein